MSGGGSRETLHCLFTLRACLPVVLSGVLLHPHAQPIMRKHAISSRDSAGPSSQTFTVPAKSVHIKVAPGSPYIQHTQPIMCMLLSGDLLIVTFHGV